MRFSAAVTAEQILPQRLAERVLPLLERMDRLMVGDDETSRAGRMTLIAFAVRIAGAVLAFGSQVLLARWMGVFEYGVFVFVWTAVIILGNLACFGTPTSIIRFVPQYLQGGDASSLRGALLASRLFVLASAGALTLAGLVAVDLLADRIEAHYLVPLVLGAICLPMMALSDLMQGFARAHDWPLRSMLPTYIIRPVLLLAGMAGALAWGLPADARTALLAAIIATSLTTLGQLLTVSSPAERLSGSAERAYHFKLWAAISFPVFLVEGFFFILTNADVLMVGMFLSPQDTAVYYAAVKILALVHFVYFAVKAGAAQRYAQYMHAGDHQALARFAQGTVSWTFWPSLGFGLLLLAAGGPLLSLFGTEFRAGHGLLFVLVLGILARAAMGPAESLLTMSGHQNACAVVYGCVLVINITLNLILIPNAGLIGAAFATSIAMVCEAGLLAVTVRRRLGISMWIGARESYA